MNSVIISVLMDGTAGETPYSADRRGKERKEGLRTKTVIPKDYFVQWACN